MAIIAATGYRWKVPTSTANSLMKVASPIPVFQGLHKYLTFTEMVATCWSRCTASRSRTRHRWPRRRSTFAGTADMPPGVEGYATRTVDRMVAQAGCYGEHVGIYAQRLLDGDAPWMMMRSVYRLVGLAKRYGPAAAEAACARALDVDVINVSTGRTEVSEIKFVETILLLEPVAQVVAPFLTHPFEDRAAKRPAGPLHPPRQARRRSQRKKLA